VGIAGATTAFASAISLTALSRTALTLPEPQDVDPTGTNVRLTIAYTGGNATAGHFRARVQYTIDGRSNEVQIT
jgi:hypothetical protein